MSHIYWAYIVFGIMLISSALVLALGMAVARRRSREESISRRRNSQDKK